MTAWAEVQRLRPGIRGSVSTLKNHRFPFYSRKILADEITVGY